ncbi:MAG: glutathionylspermidine synthase family protein [Chloroherpetonaceae bacterium]
MTYSELADALLKTGIISDAWLNGAERFQTDPVIISQETYSAMCRAAESIGNAYNELAQIVWNNPTYLDDFFYLTPFQKLMWLASGGAWHAIARLDVFLTNDGRIQICEMNSDTPSGEAEAVLLNQILFNQQLQQENLLNPNEQFEKAFCQAVLQYYQKTVREVKQTPTLGIVYPTDLPEDLSMIELYRRWFESRGMKVVLGSPRNLGKNSQGKLTLFGSEIDILYRHYKTDWWGERESAWLDGEAFEDSEPLATELFWLIEAEQSKQIALINPLGAVLTQNKLSMAFLWKYLAKFSPENQNAIRAYIPETLCISDVLDKASLEKNDWVLKSDYGCEGDEVIIGNLVSEDIWNASLQKANPNRWIVQRYFDAIKDDRNTNFGIYLVGGRASGIFTRVAKRATDYNAQCAATFLKR